MAIFNPETRKFYCECGCGTEILPWNTWSRGHQPMTAETKEKISESNSGIVFSDEHLARMSEATQKLWQTPEYRRNNSTSSGCSWFWGEEAKEAIQGRLRSEKTIEKISEAMSGRTFSKEHKESLSKASRKRWDSESGLKEREKLSKMLGGYWRTSSPNKTERCLWKFLEGHYPGLFIPQWVELNRVGRRFPDFYSAGSCKLVIESFGSHCHGPEVGRDEAEIVAEYRALGYSCIVVWADSFWDIIFEWPNLVRKIEEEIKR